MSGFIVTCNRYKLASTAGKVDTRQRGPTGSFRGNFRSGSIDADKQSVKFENR